jgi:ATP-dependent Clp protease adaptor protein ClpS
MSQTKELLDEEVIDKIENLHSLIIYNDDVNSFEHVIECLINYCKHSVEQAEQCAYIAHSKGKCDVKSGTIDELQPIKRALLDEKITATID